METISNGILSVSIDPFGAEMKALRNETDGMDLLWQGDEAVWAEQAPLLFPVVARQLGDQYTLNGRTYTMPMHGFAKSSLFFVAEKTKSSLTLRLTDDERTRQWYPFHFALTSRFCLEGNALHISHEVTNLDKTDMPYSLGEHPGYRLPMTDDTLEDYYLQFSHEEHLSRWYLDDEIIVGSEPGLDGSVLPITRHSFDRGALIFKHPASRWVSLRSRRHSHSITVSLDGWQYLGIWAKPGAPYVCIEPWCGLASSAWSSQDIWQKEGILRLAPGETGYHEMTVTVD